MRRILMSCFMRPLTYLCCLLPCNGVAAVKCSCATLLSRELGENSQIALKRISEEHPTACLQAGALIPVLSSLDFLKAVKHQRLLLSTAANMCKKLPSDPSDYVMEAVPLLIDFLKHEDSQASVCLAHIAEAFASSPDKLNELRNHDLVTPAASLISRSNFGGGQASLSMITYTGLIRLLSTCASGSHQYTKTLLLLGMSAILKDILSSSDVSASSSVPPALSRPAEQIFEIVNLANVLLPPLPKVPIPVPASVIRKMFSSGSFWMQRDPNRIAVQDLVEGNWSSGQPVGNAPEASAQVKLLSDQPELLQQFGMDLLPALIQIHGSSVSSPVRHKCLSVIWKLMYFSSAEMIQNLLSVTNISSFLAGVLAREKDAAVLLRSLQIAEILMEKLPGTFSTMFVGEGVVHAMDQLVLTGNQSTTPHASSAEKDNDFLSGTSSHSWCYRAFSGNPNPAGSLAEDSKNPESVNTGSTTSAVEIRPGDPFRFAALCACAEAFKDKWFPSDTGSAEVGATDVLLHLKNLCMKLYTGVGKRTKAKGKSKASGSWFADFTASNEEYLIGVVSDMLTKLSEGDGGSTFEFIGSGVVGALLNYFSCGYFSERIPDTNLPKLRQRACRRFKSFLGVALPSSSIWGISYSLSAAILSIKYHKLVPRILLCHIHEYSYFL